MANSSAKQKRSQQRSAGRRPSLLITLTVCAAVAAVAVAAYVIFEKQTAAGPQAKDLGIDSQALKGRWLRPDGGYVLEIRGMEPDGRIDASYFNPRPINVSRAEASREGGATRLFVELRDTGYPGCTYTLTYDPREDALKGIYYQAAVQESYEIAFVRMK